MKLDPRTTAFIFPGQGSQAVGMGRDLAAQFPAAKGTFEEADSILGYALSKLMWDGPQAELNDTINTQPALYVHSMAALRVFSAQFPDFKPAAVAGHSLGELSALSAAGALPFDGGLRLVARRGELMKEAGEKNPGGMAAILGLDIPALEKLCSEASTAEEVVQVANDNCPGQLVISGAKSAVERAIELAKKTGAKRAISLAVSIAAHSPLMAAVQEDFGAAVDHAPIGNAGTLVISNITAEPITSADQLRADLKAQLTARVRWTESIQLLARRGVTSFIEVGSGNVLLGLVRRIHAPAAGFPLGVPSDFTALG